ncbi:MAG: GreA/GreB family elongation factor [bacterium]|nr:GreA/GreB family elongation factor [bacterium]
MRVPTRRYDKKEENIDLRITQKKFDNLARSLEHLKKERPQLANEVKRLAEMGDFSENAAYQIAKGRLRGLNNRMTKLAYLLNHAVIIEEPKSNLTVQIGHTVTVEMGGKPSSVETSAGKQKKYQILGSGETNPDKNIISDSSPLGEALLDKQAGDVIKIKLKDREVEYRIIRIQ